MKYPIYIVALLTVFVPTTGAVLEDVSGRVGVSWAAGSDIAAGPRTSPAGGEPAERLMDVVVVDRQAASDDISSEDVRLAAVELFEQRFPGLAASLQVRVERIGSKIDGPSAIRIRLNHSESIPKGHTQVRLLAADGKGWSDAGWALLYVAHFDSIAIAQNNVAKNEALTDGDVTFAWMETTTFRGVPLRPADFRKLSGEGLFAERPLRSGESVRVGDVRPAYAAETGESITMTYEKNGIVLKLTCQAREPGLTGEVIRAYSPDTKATYKVILTGPGAATWKSTL